LLQREESESIFHREESGQRCHLCKKRKRKSSALATKFETYFLRSITDIIVFLFFFYGLIVSDGDDECRCDVILFGLTCCHLCKKIN